MKKYKLILFLSTALLSVACTDSFFDLEPSSSVPTDKVYKTAEDFNVAVIGCYSKLQTQVSYFTECCEYRSDNLTLSAPTAGTQDRYDIWPLHGLGRRRAQAGSVCQRGQPP